MPNHVHLILVPATPEALARALGETHRRYTGFVNARARWTGHLFQGRFASVGLEDDHLTGAEANGAPEPDGIAVAG
jgi:putative transposase